MSDELTEEEYSFEQKERLARRIQKLRKPKYFKDIENIITKHNPDLDITTNPSGKFMYFQDLKSGTYYALEKYVNKILKLKTFSETSAGAGANANASAGANASPGFSSEITKYSENDEDDTFSNNSRLKYSNKERNLIKRKIYDKKINTTDDEVNELNEFRSSTEEKTKLDSSTDIANKEIKPEDKPVSQNNVFVKKKAKNAKRTALFTDN